MPRFPCLASASLFVISLGALAALSAGCSLSPSPLEDGDAGPFPPHAPPDVTTGDGGDAGPAADGGDADSSDGGCACSRGDGGTSVVSLACFCSSSGPYGACRDYDAAIAFCPPNGSPQFNRVEEYADCNLTVISRGGLGGFAYVYDYTTHEMVGAERYNDVPTFACGDERTFRQIAGVFPAATCVRTKLVAGCGADGGDGGNPDATDVTSRDADAGDAGCNCTTITSDSGAPSIGSYSLPCFCSGMTLGRCQTYDEAFANCTGARPDFSRLDEYADCNLAVIRSSGGLGGSVHVYDYTTHDLVGVQTYTDYPGFVCGSDPVIAVQAGTFPAAGCTRTNTVTRCTRDGGDAAPESG